MGAFKRSKEKEEKKISGDVAFYYALAKAANKRRGEISQALIDELWPFVKPQMKCTGRYAGMRAKYTYRCPGFRVWVHLHEGSGTPTLISADGKIKRALCAECAQCERFLTCKECGEQFQIQCS